MKIKMQILTRTYNEFNNVVSDLEKQGWKLKRQYGGKIPNYTGHGAKLEKVCFSSDEQLPIHDVVGQSEQLYCSSWEDGYDFGTKILVL